jgi:hypothetical protein
MPLRQSFAWVKAEKWAIITDLPMKMLSLRVTSHISCKRRIGTQIGTQRHKLAPKLAPKFGLQKFGS